MSVYPVWIRRVIVSHFICDNKNVVFLNYLCQWRHVPPRIQYALQITGKIFETNVENEEPALKKELAKNAGTLVPALFHVNCFRRADVNAGLAVHTHILVNFCLLILQGNCRCRTFTHAGFASGTFLFVNDCYQLVHSSVYVTGKRKKGFLFRPAFIRKPGEEKTRSVSDLDP